MNRLINNAGITKQSIEADFDARNGNSTHYEFVGSRAECEAQRILERQSGASRIKLCSAGNGDWKLTSDYSFDAERGGGGAGAGETVTDTHELEISMCQQDVFTNPKLTTLTGPDETDSGLSAIDRHELKKYVDFWKQGKFESLEAVYEVISSGITEKPNMVKDYFNLVV